MSACIIRRRYVVPIPSRAEDGANQGRLTSCIYTRPAACRSWARGRGEGKCGKYAGSDWRYLTSEVTANGPLGAWGPWAYGLSRPLIQ